MSAESKRIASRKYRLTHRAQIKEKQREWNRNNKSRRNALNKIGREHRKLRDPKFRAKEKLRSRYGLTIEQRDEIMQRHGGLCPICLTRPATDIDHDHETGKIRDGLCRNCNRGIGWFWDNPVVVARALKYLIRHGKDVNRQALTELKKLGL